MKLLLVGSPLHEKCPYSGFFWSVFYRICTEYGDILFICPYLIRMWENTEPKNSELGHLSRIVHCGDSPIMNANIHLYYKPELHLHDASKWK